MTTDKQEQYKNELVHEAVRWYAKRGDKLRANQLDATRRLESAVSQYLESFVRDE